MSLADLERSIARKLTTFPGLKKKIKYLRSLIFAIISPGRHLTEAVGPLQAVSDQSSSFFGYFDSSPDNGDGRVLVMQPNGADNCLPRAVDTIDVKVVDSDDGSTVYQESTSSFNWQQGCRAHWLTTHEIIFNCLDDKAGHHIAKKVSLTENTETKIYDRPLQAVFRDKFFVSINYRRLASAQPEYGYFDLPALSESEMLDDEDDGIWLVDLRTGISRLIVSLASLRINSDDLAGDCLHSVNHCSISPDGMNMIFIHRYYNDGRRYDRLYLYGFGDDLLRVLPTDDMVSHYCWVDEKRFVAYLRLPDQADAYYLFDLETFSFQSLHLERYISQGDGHPCFKNGWMLTDTYPDRRRLQHLYAYHFATDQCIKLGQFWAPMAFYGATRCDLHPRFSADGNEVFLDSCHEGFRRLYSLDVSNIFGNKK